VVWDIAVTVRRATDNRRPRGDLWPLALDANGLHRYGQDAHGYWLVTGLNLIRIEAG